MPQQRIYYEKVDNKLIPYWYVITFDVCEVNWDKSVLYYEAIAPLSFVERDEFDESLASFSVHFSDFIVHRDKPDHLGLNLTTIKKRINRYGVDPYTIRQFIIQLSDIYEIMKLLPKSTKMLFLLKKIERS